DLRNLPANAAFPRAPRENAAAVVCSDFYAPLDKWRAWLKPLATKMREGTLLQVCDPIEEAYPFTGRDHFFRPGEERERLIGRAETIREGYIERFTRRRQDMIEVAAELGWRFVSTTTKDDPRTALGNLAYGFTDGAAA